MATYSETNNTGSGTNTILIVLLMLLIVGALFWAFAGHRGVGTANTSGGATPSNLNVDLNLPGGGGAQGGAQGGSNTGGTNGGAQTSGGTGQPTTGG